MKYLIDTDICIYIINQLPQNTYQKFKTMSPGDLAVSSITVAELQFGVSKSLNKRENQFKVDKFLLPLHIVDFNFDAAEIYGNIRASLEKTGKSIGPMDLLIAATAKQYNLILVTNNEREFRRVKGLKIENWS